MSLLNIIYVICEISISKSAKQLVSCFSNAEIFSSKSPSMTLCHTKALDVFGEISFSPLTTTPKEGGALLCPAGRRDAPAGGAVLSLPCQRKYPKKGALGGEPPKNPQYEGFRSPHAVGLPKHQLQYCRAIAITKTAQGAAPPNTHRTALRRASRKLGLSQSAQQRTQRKRFLRETQFLLS